MNYDAMTYLLLTFGSCLGILQIATVSSDLRGMWFARSPLVTLILGSVILGVTYIWFFTCADLNMNANDAAVVEGHEQLVFFLLGAFFALILTFIVSSIVNRKGFSADAEPVIGKGIEDLKTRTVYQAIMYRWRKREKA